MTLATLVTGGQLLSAVAWLMVTYHYLPSLGRTFRQAANQPGGMLAWDAAGCWAALIGITQTLYTVRWILLGRDDIASMSRVSLIVWIPLYFLNAACAVGVLYTWRDSRTDAVSLAASDRRAVNAVIAWLTLAVVCIGAASWNL